MLKINNGSYKYKNVDASDNVMLTYCKCVCPYKHLVSKTSIVEVSLGVATYHINSGSSVNFIQGCVIITLSVFIYKYVYVNWMYLFYIPLY